MNYITFHNRETICKAYQYTPGNQRCIICSNKYCPEYTKAENIFLLLDCKHLIHRQCLKNSRRLISNQNWKEECQLCKKNMDFYESGIKIAIRRNQRRQDDYYIQQQFENVVKCVQKTGRFSYK